GQGRGPGLRPQDRRGSARPRPAGPQGHRGLPGQRGMTPMLEVRGLRSGYGAVRVLHGLDFAIEAGHIAVILGANGAGKTTTLRALSGMIPAKGEVLFEGHDIIGKSTEAL